jgi:hypothetical protein
MKAKGWMIDSLVIASFFIFLFIKFYPAWSNPIDSMNDAVHYIEAAKSGFGDNYFDFPSKNIIEYTKRIFERFRFEAGSGIWWEDISNNVPNALRHFHSPYFIYIPSLLYMFTDKSSFWQTRITPFVFLLLTSALIYFSVNHIFYKNKKRIYGFAAAAVFLYFFASATELSPHIMFGFFNLFALISFSYYWKSRDRKILTLSFIFLSLSMAALDSGVFAFILIFAFLAYEEIIVNKDVRKFFYTYTKDFFIIFIITLYISWPGGVLKLNFFKNFFVNTFFAVTNHTCSFFRLITDNFLLFGLSFFVVLFFMLIILNYRKEELILPMLVYILGVFIFFIFVSNRKLLYVYPLFFSVIYLMGAMPYYLKKIQIVDKE